MTACQSPSAKLRIRREIDHRPPLSKGGVDSPANMGSLTTQQHRAKTHAEQR